MNIFPLGGRARGAAPYCTKCTVWGVVSLTRPLAEKIHTRKEYFILGDVKPGNKNHSIGVAYRLLWCHCRAFWYRIVVLLKERITLCFITVCCVAKSDGCRFRLEQHVYPVCYKRFVDGNLNWCVYSLRGTQTGCVFNLIATHFSQDCLSYDPQDSISLTFVWRVGFSSKCYISLV